jgi:dethiobiotin synthetase
MYLLPTASNARSAPRRLFITGTDTGVGKTTVGAALVRTLVARGVPVAVVKPLESGVPLDETGPRPPDTIALLEAAGIAPIVASIAAACAYPLRAPLAPPVAADLEGVTIDPVGIDALIDAASARVGPGGLTVIEGAGGLLAPAWRDPVTGELRFVADLIARSGAVALVVARAGLGTINQSLLTLEALKTRGIACAGLVLNTTSESDRHGDPSVAHNRQTLESALAGQGPPVFGPVPHGAEGRVSAGAPEIDRLATHLARALGLDKVA